MVVHLFAASTQMSACSFSRDPVTVTNVREVQLTSFRGHAPLFAFSAFSALAQPTLTSSLCCLRHATIFPSPGATPAHIFSASALQRARGAAALAARINPQNEIRESNEAAVN